MDAPAEELLARVCRAVGDAELAAALRLGAGPVELVVVWNVYTHEAVVNVRLAGERVAVLYNLSPSRVEALVAGAEQVGWSVCSGWGGT